MYCSKCGANLKENFEDRTEAFGKQAEEWGKALGKRAEEWGEDFGNRMEKECFGLPHGGTIVGIIFGLFIIIIGVGMIMGWTLNIGAYAMILIGALILLSAIYALTRK